MFVCLSFCLIVCLSVCPFVCSSFYLFSFCFFLSVCLFIWFSVGLFVNLYVCVLFCGSVLVCWIVCCSVFLFVLGSHLCTMFCRKCKRVPGGPESRALRGQEVRPPVKDYFTTFHQRRGNLKLFHVKIENNWHQRHSTFQILYAFKAC